MLEETSDTTICLIDYFGVSVEQMCELKRWRDPVFVLRDRPFIDLLLGFGFDEKVEMILQEAICICVCHRRDIFFV